MWENEFSDTISGYKPLLKVAWQCTKMGKKCIPSFFKLISFYFWLCWVFVAASRGYSLAVVHGLLIAGSSLVAGLSCPAACGIFPDQGSNPCPLHWQADA